LAGLIGLASADSIVAEFRLVGIYLLKARGAVVAIVFKAISLERSQICKNHQFIHNAKSVGPIAVCVPYSK
jgi:hypothetical protein